MERRKDKAIVIPHTIQSCWQLQKYEGFKRTTYKSLGRSRINSYIGAVAFQLKGPIDLVDMANYSTKVKTRIAT